MRKFIEKLSRKIGFTTTESNVILFLLTAFLVGLVVNYIKETKNSQEFLEFDYKYQDSLFNAAVGNVEVGDTTEKNVERRVDSKHELLDFRSAKKELKNEKKLTEIINLNSATAAQLMKLPGIGEKTAANIIEYRNKIGGFKNIDDLLNVKGIGKAKLQKIKSFVKI